MAVLFTIGYQGADLRSFLAVLGANRIEEVIDVRLVAASRRAAFSKTALARLLARRGIGYSHRAELGCPRDIRIRYGDTADFGRYSQQYRARVLSRRRQIVSQLASAATRRRLCLLCFEEEPEKCHRSLLAQAAVASNGRVLRLIHLKAPSSARTPPG